MEIGQLAEIEDFTPLYNWHLSLGRNPSTSKWKVLFNGVYGSDTPPKTIKFIVVDVDDNAFFCLYNKNENKLFFEKLTVRDMS